MRAAVLSGVEPGSTSGDPQRSAVRGGQELHAAAEHLVFLAEPHVIAVVTDARQAVGPDEGAVQEHVRHAFPSAAARDVVQVGGLLREDVDAFVEVPVAGGLGDPGVPCETVHAAPLTEPTQHQHGLTERTQRP